MEGKSISNETKSSRSNQRSQLRAEFCLASRSTISQLFFFPEIITMRKVSYRNNDFMLGKLEEMADACACLDTSFISENGTALGNYASMGFKSSDRDVSR